MKTLTPEEEAILEKTRQWVEALESGNYKQGANLLRKKDNFCCLGVLCDLKIKNEEDGEWGMTGESEAQQAMAFLQGQEDFTFAIPNRIFDTYNLVKAETTIPVEVIPPEANTIITPRGASQIINDDTTFIDVLITMNDSSKEHEGFGRIWMTIEAIYKHFGYEL